MTVTGEPCVIRAATDDDRAAWDAYVDRHPEGRFFHLYGWLHVARAAYGYQSRSLIAQRGETIVGVLPLVDIRAPLTGRALISTAFTIGGGPLGDDEQVVTELMEASVELGRETRARYVEWRSATSLPGEWDRKTGVYAQFEIPLQGDDAAMLKNIPRRRRAVVRKALKAEEAGDLRVGLQIGIDDFYDVYAHALRNHGTPVFPKKFLRTIAETFPQHTEISIALHRGRPLAGLVSFFYKDRVMPYYNGAFHEARDVYASDLLYWKQMCRAMRRGVPVYDFGRSKYGTGPFDYKVFWGAEPQPITYHYALVGARETPDLNPKNSKFETVVNLWRRLPVPVANRLGPMVSGNFP